MNIDALVDAVSAKTQGTKGDPLSREEVDQVVRATVAELTASGSLAEETAAEPTPEEPSVG